MNMKLSLPVLLVIIVVSITHVTFAEELVFSFIMADTEQIEQPRVMPISNPCV